MKTHIEIYNEIMDGCPKIDTKNWATIQLTYNNFHRITSKISFEEMIWFKCKPNKELANMVYDYAQTQLNLQGQ